MNINSKPVFVSILLAFAGAGTPSCAVRARPPATATERDDRPPTETDAPSKEGRPVPPPPVSY